MYSKFLKKATASLMAGAMAMTGMAVSYSGVVSAEETKYEFENATLSSTIETEADKSASGGSVAYMKGDGTITAEFEVATAGMYDITIYAQGVGGSKQQTFKVNGVSQGSLSIPESKAYEPIKTSVKLNAGKNEFSITASWGWSKFDYFTVSSTELPAIKATQTYCSDASATAETQSLMAYLASVYGEHIISGQQEIYKYGPHDFEYEFEYLEKLTGHMPAIRGFDYGNFICPAFGSDDGSTERVIDWVKNRNGIATASVHLNVPTDFENYTIGSKIDWDKTTYSEKTDFSPSKVVIEGTKENEYYMQALTTLAGEFKKLEAQGIPVMFRPLHEAEGGGGETGSWFWWGREGSSAYKDLWIYTYKTMTEKFDCHNLIWVWNSYNFDTSADWYPGDDYVDIIGYDKYNCTKYLAENNWQPSYEHDTSAIAPTFYGILERYNSKKMVAMAENDSFSTVENLTSDKAGWLYFMTWYDGGSDNINFLTNPLFNTEEDTIAMYQSDYCITLDELPATLYSEEVEPVERTTTTTATGDSETTTTTTATDEYKFAIQKKSVKLPAGSKLSTSVEITIKGEPGASVGGGIGYGTTADDWANIEWNGTIGKDGTLKKTVPVDKIPDDITTAEVQVWWSNVWDSATETGIDKPYEIVSAEVSELGKGDVVEPTLYGDANVDGDVTLADAVLILQSLANPDNYSLTEQGKANADVAGNNDGVTANDALVIQMVEAGTYKAEDLPIKE